MITAAAAAATAVPAVSRPIPRTVKLQADDRHYMLYRRSPHCQPERRGVEVRGRQTTHSAYALPFYLIHIDRVTIDPPTGRGTIAVTGATQNEGDRTYYVRTYVRTNGRTAAASAAGRFARRRVDLRQQSREYVADSVTVDAVSAAIAQRGWGSLRCAVNCRGQSVCWSVSHTARFSDCRPHCPQSLSVQLTALSKDSAS